MSETAVATTAAQRPPIVVLRDRLEMRRGELKAALTDVSPELFIRSIITSVQISPDLLACDFASLWLACMRACRDGLLPDGVEAALVPYKNRVTYIPMYQGQLRQFRRSGVCKWITANVVRQGEEFMHYIDETGEHFRHVPGDSFDAPITKIYALATTKDGGVFCTVMTISEANKIKAMSKASRDDSPWKLWPEEMLKKTALHRLHKLLPTGRDRLPQYDDDERDPDAIERLREALNAPTAPAEEQDKVKSVASSLDVFAQDGKGEAEPKSSTDVAFEAGAAAKAAGHQRRAIPGEYRDPARSAEAAAWHAGWDKGTEKHDRTDG